jgi:MOSC domain-containing protein YiiM
MSMSSDEARVLDVCLVHNVGPGYFGETAIDKRPVGGPVAVTELGLVGDRQLGRSHGGLDKAVYCYAAEDARWWSDKIDRPCPPGMFGENLRTQALDVSRALLGERWRIGEVLLEVRMPRTPCENLSLRIGIEGFHVQFNASGRVGALLRVLERGVVQAADRIVVESRPDHEVTVAAWATGVEAPQMRHLLDSGLPLARGVRAKARRIVARESNRGKMS